MKLVRVGTTDTYSILIMQDGAQVIFAKSMPVAAYQPAVGRAEPLWRKSINATKPETRAYLARYLHYFRNTEVITVSQEQLEAIVEEM